MFGPVVHGPRAFDNEKYLEEQSAAMQQISASSQDLAKMAGVLAEAVNRFRV